MQAAIRLAVGCAHVIRTIVVPLKGKGEVKEKLQAKAIRRKMLLLD